MIKKIEHIGIAVKSIEKSIPLFRDLLGIPLKNVFESDAIKTKIAFFPLGESTIELIEPMDPESAAGKFIQKRGEGIHHICLAVENVEAALREFEAEGDRASQQDAEKDAGWADDRLFEPEEHQRRSDRIGRDPRRIGAEGGEGSWRKKRVKRRYGRWFRSWGLR